MIAKMVLIVFRVLKVERVKKGLPVFRGPMSLNSRTADVFFFFWLTMCRLTLRTLSR